MYYQMGNSQGTITISKTSTNTGTLSSTNLSKLKLYPQLTITYDNDIYYRMSPQNASYLEYYHLDTSSNSGGVANATGYVITISAQTRN